MLFVDTSVWFEAFDLSAPRHEPCRSLIRESRGNLVTTDYVFDELVTLLLARDLRRNATVYVPSLLDSAVCRFERVNDADFAEAWRLVQKFSDKRWSFTDCTSYAVIERLGVTEALSLDDHFRQFGTVKVLP